MSEGWVSACLLNCRPSVIWLYGRTNDDDGTKLWSIKFKNDFHKN